MRRGNNFGEASAAAANFLDDLVDLGAPDEGFRVVVPVLDPGLDRTFESGDAAEEPARV